MWFEKQHLINELFRFVALLESSWDFIFTPVGLTVKTYAVLYLISTGIDTSKKLLAWTYGTKPNMTKKLKYLEEHGFIWRNIDPDDKRVIHFHLTQKSQNALRKITPTYEHALWDIFEWVTSNDIERVQRTISKSSDILVEILSRKKSCWLMNAREIW